MQHRTRQNQFIKKDNKALTALTEEETQKLIDLTRNRQGVAMFVVLAINTGAEVSELKDLRKRDLQTDESGIIAVSLNGRSVTLSKDASEQVQDLLPEGSPREFVIYNLKSLNPNRQRGLSRTCINEFLREFGKKIDRPDLNPTILRHTFITNFEGNAKELGVILGIDEKQAEILLRRRNLANPYQLPHIPAP